MNPIVEEIIYYLASFIAVAVVLSFHEFAHAFVSYKCGDPTAKMLGRCSLNPVVHFDLLGLLMFTIAGFGWAKPVPINPLNYKHYRRGLFLTAIAGVTMNFIMAFLFYPLFLLVLLFVNLPWLPIQYFLILFTNFLWLYSLSFCVFNLIPLPPLDGWRVVDALVRKRGKVFYFFERFGNLILIVLIALHYIARLVPQIAVIDVLGYVLSFVQNIFAQPISLFWGLIF